MAGYSSSEQTRQALINAAGELAAEQGFGNVTTRAIASGAGENVGSIHYHFGGKDKLFQTVLMEATSVMRETPLDLVLAPLGPLLDTPEGQSRAIRLMIQTKIDHLFAQNRATWHCRVIYQALRRANPLRDWLLEEIIEPSMDVEQRLFKRIRPEMSDEECMMHALVTCTPLYFHGDYMESILEHLGADGYSPEYMQRLEDRIVKQTQLYFGLPDDLTPNMKTEKGDAT